jgi:ribonuclease P protein component
VKREFRLTRFGDFMRVRRAGKSYAHPLVVLIVKSNALSTVRIGVAAGRSVGNAVERNRAKRRMRSCIHRQLPSLVGGRDLILLARKPIAEATFQQIDLAIQGLLERAGLLNKQT